LSANPGTHDSSPQPLLHGSRIPAGTAHDMQRVVAAVIRRGDALLVCQRPAHKRHGGLWEFPGGKCDPGESDADAITRELHEELGVAVTAVGATIASITDEGSPYEIVFLPVAISGEPVCLEHDALHWGTPHELLARPLAPSDQRFLERLTHRA
jgi:mutator protein MutT